MKVNNISIVNSLRAIKFTLMSLFSMVLSVETYAQSTPYLSALDIDGDCYYQIGFNAPLNVPSNYNYELYEKIGSGLWPSSPIVVRSIAAGNIAPFYFQRTSNPIGIYTYKSRVCIANTASCSGFSNEIMGTSENRILNS